MIDQVLQASQFFKERLAPKHKKSHNGHADSDHDDDQEHEHDGLDHLIFRENPAHRTDRP